MSGDSRSAVGPDTSEAPPASGPHRWSPVTILLTVALVLLVAVAGTAAYKAHQLGAVEDARAEALKAARSRVPLLLSYRSATLRRDLDRAAKQTTGAFARDYRQILDDVVQPAASKDGVSTSATVNASGVVRARTDDVVVLVFLTQTTTRRGATSPSVSGSRVEVTMRRAGESWKIAGLDPR